MASHVWQTDFPSEAAGKIAVAVIARNFSSALIEDMVPIIEYGWRQIVPGAALGVFSGKPDSRDVAFSILADHAKAAPMGIATALPIPWITILSTLLKIILARLEPKSAAEMYSALEAD